MIATTEVQGLVVLSPRQLQTLRRSLLAVSVIPLVGLGIAVATLWGRGISGADLAIFGISYAIAGLGVTVGFHRLLAHRAFEAHPAARAALAAAGSLAIEMSVIDWVATHRRHHAYADAPGDPHSPNLEEGVLRGLWHAHMGWLFGPERSSRERWAPDLLKDPTLRKIDSLFPLFVTLSFVLPAVAGLVVTRSITGALTAFLWGGLVRIFLLHHVTFSINSLCHVFGRRPYDTKERSTNVWPLSVLSFGESWHNNHHAFPSSAWLGQRFWQPDPGAWLIRALAVAGLARKLKRPGSTRRDSESHRDPALV